MDISDWSLYYKIHETKRTPTTTQMCYEPRVSPDKQTFCMNFCFPCDYQTKQPRLSYTDEFVEYMFQREVRYLDTFRDKPWVPEILDIKARKIFFRWYGKTCNESIYQDDNLNSSWYNDIKGIILDQANEGYIKATMYPHSHYYDYHGRMRTFDFYATIERSRPYLDYNDVTGLVGFDTDRFMLAKEGDQLNIETLFKSGLLAYSRWPENLTEIYNIIYGQN